MQKKLAHKVILALAWLAAIAVVPIYTYKLTTKTDYSDFDVYHRAASRAQSGAWQSIYDYTKDGTSPFRYAPPSLLLFRPLAELPLQSARVVWLFLQFAFFALSFRSLFKSLRRINPQSAGWITGLSFLFILRFCLDSFTIGQVTSLMLLGFCLSLEGWLANRPSRAGAALFVPSFFKIGPAVLYGLFFLERPEFRRKALGAAFTVFFVSCGLIWLWSAPHIAYTELWRGWFNTVAADSSYYDASHYGSQSLKSVLLRLSAQGWFARTSAETTHLVLTICGILGVLSFWIFRTTQTARGRGLFFCLGLFAYLWFMPETFKYALVFLAIPVAILLSGRLKRFERVALVLGACTLSLAGYDIIGQTLFFAMQRYSIPFFATTLLAAAIVRQAWQESTATRLIHKVGPWETTPTVQSDIDLSVLVPFPASPQASVQETLFLERLSRLQDFAKNAKQLTCEILVIPFGEALVPNQPAVASSDGNLTLLPQVITNGAAAALRLGFLSSKGKLIAFYNLEQFVDLAFLNQALEQISKGHSLVRANRRLAQSQFKIPVRLLPFVYQRHRLGLLFNQLVRKILPIQSTDTSSGTLCMTRELALTCFANQTFPNLLFDLELALSAQAHRAKEIDLPVHISLEEEKKTSRVVAEVSVILAGLPLLAKRYRQGCYHPLTRSLQITADDWGLTPAVNEGILELAKLGVIKRVSVMATSKFLTHRLPELQAIPGIELGLHFNLTHGTGYSPLQWLKRFLLIRGRARQELGFQVVSELEQQLSNLETHGIQAQYVDGHHHIHLVPGVISTISQSLKAAKIKRVRLPYDPDLWFTLKFPLAALSLLAKRHLQKEGFDFVSCFYPQHFHFEDHGRFRARLAQDPGAEVIVHPAHTNDLHLDEHGDTYTEGRVKEYQALKMFGVLWNQDLS